MANAYDSTTQLSNLNQTAYDKAVAFALRDQPFLRADLVDKRPVDVSMAAKTIVLSKYADMAAVTTPLSELVTPDSQAIANPTQVTVTLDEYGAWQQVTSQAEHFLFSDIDPAIWNILARQMVESLDKLVLTKVLSSTNQVYAGASGALDSAGAATTDVAGTEIIGAPQIRRIVAKLRKANVAPKRGGLYAAYIHPDVSVDLREGVGAADWRQPHNYSAPENLWEGEVGSFDGAYFIESGRMYSATDGASSARVHRSIFAGREGIVEAVAQEPQIVEDGFQDPLHRFKAVGWKFIAGWAIYRPEAVVILNSASSAG